MSDSAAENVLFVCYCNGHDVGFLFDENLMERPDHQDCHAKLWKFHLDKDPAEKLQDLFKSVQNWFEILHGGFEVCMLWPFDGATPEQGERLSEKFEKLKKIVGYQDPAEDDPEVLVDGDDPEWFEDENDHEGLEDGEESGSSSEPEEVVEEPEVPPEPEAPGRILNVCYCNTCAEAVTYDEDFYTIPQEHEDCSVHLYEFDLNLNPMILKDKFRTMEGLFDCAMQGVSPYSIHPRRSASEETRERLCVKFAELMDRVALENL